jgi:hypothetical protein
METPAGFRDGTQQPPALGLKSTVVVFSPLHVLAFFKTFLTKKTLRNGEGKLFHRYASVYGYNLNFTVI